MFFLTYKVLPALLSSLCFLRKYEMSNNQVLICSRNMGSIAGSQLDIGNIYGKILKIKGKFVFFSKSNFFEKNESTNQFH